MKIHPTALVDAGAELGPEVEVGPHAIIEAGVTLGARCRVDAHAYLRGPLVAGEDNWFAFSTAIGHPPQIKGKSGPFGSTRIGHRNVFREFSQIHQSMFADDETVVGDDCLFMVGAHIAHDCRVGSHVILANNVLLGGHILVQDRAILSGSSAVHQFCRIGELAMVGGGAAIARDVAPYAMISGQRPATLKGVNIIGMRRAELPREVRNEIRAAYRTLFRSELLIPERIDRVQPRSAEVERLVAFVRESRRGVIGMGLSNEFQDKDDVERDDLD
jgi:UDP-N-acetylglucosamine acyltransferase